jgi:hypothetical protein
MENLLGNIEELIGVLIAVLVAVQAIIVYIMPPEKAEKWNWVGKVLGALVKTKAGISPRRDDGKVS